MVWIWVYLYMNLYILYLYFDFILITIMNFYVNEFIFSTETPLMLIGFHRALAHDLGLNMMMLSVLKNIFILLFIYNTFIHIFCHICYYLLCSSSWRETRFPLKCRQLLIGWKWKWKSFSCVWLFAIPWKIQSMEFSRT